MDRLHLDLLAGARADMIAGALVAVGAPLDAAVEALAQVGLPRLDVVSEETARAGLRATRLRIMLDGVDVGGIAAAAGAGAGARNLHALISKRGRHRHHTAKPRLDAPTRTAPLVAAATAAVVADTRAGRGGVADDRAILAAARGKGRRSSRAPAAPEKWLSGVAAPANALVDVVKDSDLEPIPKALALKAMRRVVDALAHVAADGARTKLPGVRAARLLADVVTGAAFVSALAPASVTSSPIGLSMLALDDDELSVARAWLLEVLAGVPVVELELELEHDVNVSPVDVAGAAFAWAVVQRFGARGVTTSTKQGLGASAVEAPGRAVVARALLGPPPFVATRAGSREVSAAVVVEGTAPLDVDAPALSRTLRALAGSDVDLSAPGSHGVRVRVLLAVGGAQAGAYAVDDVTTALWRAGCVDVVATWVERRRPGVQEVTVAIGRGRTKASVRVVLLSNGDEILRIDPDMDDVRAAAAKRGESVHAIAAAAVALATSGRVSQASVK